MVIQGLKSRGVGISVHVGTSTHEHSVGARSTGVKKSMLWWRRADSEAQTSIEVPTKAGASGKAEEARASGAGLLAGL